MKSKKGDGKSGENPRNISGCLFDWPVKKYPHWSRLLYQTSKHLVWKGSNEIYYPLLYSKIYLFCKIYVQGSTLDICHKSPLRFQIKRKAVLGPPRDIFSIYVSENLQSENFKNGQMSASETTVEQRLEYLRDSDVRNKMVLT